ncbi:MAG: class II glutamine amidotransferase [Deltaproteobacteria bacterium]|nr:class II glutamine amidotransferase [Deltaproteobacteria bacterium]
MARLFGYMGNFSERLRHALYQEREVLAVSESSRPDAWGIGFYQGGEVLHKKRPFAGPERVDWLAVTSGLRADCLVGHVRHATIGDLRADNTQPFRFRSWLFAHSGTVSRFEAVRPRLLEGLPDFLRRSVRGDTDSELIFYAILSFLHDAGQLDNPDVAPEAITDALRATVAQVDRLVAEFRGERSSLDCILTNGRTIMALHRGGPPMRWAERKGIMQVDPAAKDAKNLDLDAVRYVLVVGGATKPSIGYSDLPDGSAIAITRDLEVRTFSIT